MMSTTRGAVKTDRAILSALICFRLLNGFFLQSTFHPDEEWQSSEVAHYLVFGYGFLTWEWEKCIALRSVAHPAVFAVMFWVLKQLHLDFPDVIAVAPRLLQSFIAALTDYGVIQLAKEWYGGATALDSAEQDVPGVTVLRPQKKGSILETHPDSRGNGLTRHPKSRAETLPTSSEQKTQCRLRNAAESTKSGFQRASLVTSHWISRIYHAENIADVTKGASLVDWITLCFLFSWFNFFCLPRTYSNCLEAFLTVYALLFFARAHRDEYVRVRRSVTTRKSTVIKPPELSGTYITRVAGGTEQATSEGSKTSVEHETERQRPKGEDVRVGTGGKIQTDSTLGSLSTLPGSSQQPRSPTFYTFLALSCAALSVIVRPPATVFWTAFCMCKLFQHLRGSSPSGAKDLEDEATEKRGEKAALFLCLCFVAGALVVGCNLYIDYLFYGKLIFPPLNFARFNLLMGSGRHFGEHPWHYYLVECPAVVLLTFYPFFVLGVKFWVETLYRLAANYYTARVQRTGEKGIRTLEIAKYLAGYIMSRDDGAALLGTVSCLLLLSFSTHKEYRFMVSYMPVLLTYVGIGIAGVVNGNAQLFTALSGQRKAPDTVSTLRAKAKGFLARLARKQRTAILLLVFGAQVVFAIYFSFFHHRGTLPVIRFLRRLPEGSSVFFLTPSHELPYYSQVHRRFPMGFLDSTPRLRHELNFPENWETRFWTSAKKSDYISFLDSFFILPSDPHQILVSPSPALQVSRTSIARSHSSRVSMCPAPTTSQSLSSLFSQTSDVIVSAHPSPEPSSASSASTVPASTSPSWARRKKDLRNVADGASASRTWMKSDIYSRIPHDREDLSSSLAAYLFGDVRSKMKQTESIHVASGKGGTEELSKMGSTEAKESSDKFSAVDNSWFGDATQFRRRLCRVRRWSHSENCEVTPSFEECLDYRFLVPLKGHLPTHFVLTSGIYERIPEWFSSRGYVVRFGPIFDSIVAESPRGKVLWQSLYVLERRLPASSVVFA